MTENDPAHSGSRWEPPPAPDEWRTAPVPAGASDDVPTGQVPPAARRSGRARRGVLAGAGAGILVIGGVGGFAAGHALAGTGTGGDSPSVVQNGFPGRSAVPGERDGGGRFGPPGGFDRDGDHGGFDGAAPGTGNDASGGDA